MNTLNTDLDFLETLFGEDITSIESPEYPDVYLDYYGVTKDIDNSHFYWATNTPKSLEELVIAMVNNQPESQVRVELNDYLTLLHKGFKPTKALFRLGVEQQLAGILGSLKLATTAEEIQTAYDNPNILSCMTQYSSTIGQFYNGLGIQLLYSDRYRLLIDLNRNWKSFRGYGVLHAKIDSLISKVLSTYMLEINVEVSRTQAHIRSYRDGTSFFCFDTSTVNGIPCSGFPYLDSITLEYSIDTSIEKTQEDVLNANTKVIGTSMETFLDIYDIASAEIVWAKYDTLYGDYFLAQKAKESGKFKGYSNYHRLLPVYEYNDCYFVLDGYSIVLVERKLDVNLLNASKNPDGTFNINIQQDLPF